MLKKFKFSTLMIGAIPLTITTITIPLVVIEQQQSKLNGINIFTTYDNALDNLIALGYAPDYDNFDSSKNKYSSYLKNYINEQMTEFVDIPVRQDEELFQKEIYKMKIDTIVLNEWQKGIESKLKSILNNVAYTSMGDSDEARYLDSIYSGGYSWQTQTSIDEGLRMLAKDLDSIYKLNDLLIKKAEDIIAKDKLRISFINQNNISFHDKTIGILNLKANDKTEINTKFDFFSPYVYPMIYATNKEKGIGMQFPEPNDKAFINETHGYKERDAWNIYGSDGIDLISQFSKKFDYLIISAPNNSFNKTISKQDIMNSKIVEMLKSPQENNLLFTNNGQIYQSAWGVIGKRVILDELVSFLKLKDIKEGSKWIPTEPSKLKRLRYYDRG